jgi:hypothetical protein
MSCVVESHGWFRDLTEDTLGRTDATYLLGREKPPYVSNFNSVNVAAKFTGKSASTLSDLVALAKALYMTKSREEFRKKNPMVLESYQEIAKDETKWKEFCKVLHSENDALSCTTLRLIDFRGSLKKIK